LRVVSLVPSLTETLLACGVEVVGRTRYCIHPAETVRDITVVGGTKGVNWQKVSELAPDVVVMDREENTRQMADDCPVPWVATHVTSIAAAGDDLMMLADHLGSGELETLASGWQRLAAAPDRAFSGWLSIPGVQSPLGQSSADFDSLEYMIWRDPWMAAGSQTFIGSMLKRVGLGSFLKPHPEAYPQLTGPMPEDGTFYLFSSEPYPFARHTQELADCGFNGALVDGEFFSWFGIRSYRMLEAYLET